MSEERAYCCLNCANLPPCSESAGNCVSCCADCGDTSMCKQSAYFKDGSFYLNYKSTFSYNMSRDYSDTTDVFTGYINTQYGYDSKTNKASINGSSNYNHCAEDGDADHTQVDCNGPTCYGGGCDNNEDCFIPDNHGCYPKCTDDCYSTTSNENGGIVCVDDTCGSFDHGCSGLECVGCTPEDECEGTYSVTLSGKISFNDSAKLYNSKGEDVGNIVGASYDPCNPCATWGAPPCHYFST